MKNGELMEKIKKNDDFDGGPKTNKWFHEVFWHHLGIN